VSVHEQPIQSLPELFPFRFVAQRRVMREHQPGNHHAHSAAFFAQEEEFLRACTKKAQVAINLAGKNRRRRGARFKINENPFGRRKRTRLCGLRRRRRRLDEDEFALLEALAAARSLFNTTGAHAIWFSDTRSAARKIFSPMRHIAAAERERESLFNILLIPSNNVMKIYISLLVCSESLIAACFIGLFMACLKLPSRTNIFQR
jgi:hypothetical protein